MDAGESFGAWRMGDDAALFAEVSSANLACGFHAGEPLTIRTSLAPRSRMSRSARTPGCRTWWASGAADGDDAAAGLDDTLYQVGVMYGFVRAAGAPLHHVKPHGALNTAVAESSDENAEAIVEAVRYFDRALPVVAIAGSRLHRAAERLGQPVVAEAFPDRGYAPDGSLARRGTPGAIIHDAELAASRAVRMVLDGTVEALDGTVVELAAGTLCIHGDNPGSVATARAVRAALEREGVSISAF